MSVVKKFWNKANLQSRRWIMERRIDAIERNDIAQLNDFLSDEHPMHPNELYLALIAAFQKKTDDAHESIRILLQHGGDPNGKDSNGVPFIVYATENNCLKIVKLLVSNPLCIIDNVRDDGSSALHRAVWNGNEDFTSVLLDSGADVNLQDTNGRTPFLIAAEMDHTGIMEKLLIAGCDPAMTDKKKRTALHWSSFHNSFDVLSFILEEDEDVRQLINTQDCHGNTALMLAAGEDCVESIETLLRYEADVNLQNSQNRTALLLAAREHKENTVHCLLNHNVNVNIRDEFKFTALMYLVHDASLVEILIELGADLDIITDYGESPLLKAIKCDYIPATKLLIQNNCSSFKSILKDRISYLIIKKDKVMLKFLLNAYICLGYPGTTSLHNYVVTVIRSRKNIDNRLQADENVRRIWFWFLNEMESLNKVISLQQISRQIVRNQLHGPYFRSRLRSLPIPPSIKYYLLLPDLEVSSH